MAKKKNTPAPEEKASSKNKRKKAPSDAPVSEPVEQDINDEADVGDSDFSLFAHVPDSGEVGFFADIEDLDEDELSKIEEDAIAALPRAEVEPELLMYDPEEIEDTHESPEENAKYEEFLKNYKLVMEQMLNAAKESSAKKSSVGLFDDEGDISELVVTEDEDDEGLFDEDEPITLSELKGRKKREKKASNAKTSEADEHAIANINSEVGDIENTTDSDNVSGASDDTELAEVENATDSAETSGAYDDTELGEATVEADASEVAENGEDNSSPADNADNEDAAGDGKDDSVEDDADSEDAAGDGKDDSVEDDADSEDAASDGKDDSVAEAAESYDASDSEEQSASKDESFDPLSTISLLEYVPYLTGEVSDTDEAEEDEPSDENADELFDEPEQLEIDFGDEDYDADDEEGENYEEVADEEYSSEKTRLIDTVFDLIEMFIFTFVAVMIITTFFVRHSIVDGPSMENTLENRDVVIISDLFYQPKRGDIIVFEDRAFSDKVLIKRVIAIEGDRVSVMPSGDVYVNGRLVDDSYVYESYHKTYNHIDNLLVGEGEVFVLGDHRNVSLDSEDYGKTVKVDSILGKVLFRLFPLDSFGSVD